MKMIPQTTKMIWTSKLYCKVKSPFKELNNMKGVMITAPASGSSKTVVTMGIIRALADLVLMYAALRPYGLYRYCFYPSSLWKGGWKPGHAPSGCGWHGNVLLMGEEYCVIEGAMGYFDGIYNTYENSVLTLPKH